MWLSDALPLLQQKFGPVFRVRCKIYLLRTHDLEVFVSSLQVFTLKTVIEIGIQKGSTAKILLANGPWVENTLVLTRNTWPIEVNLSVHHPKTTKNL
jgi:hypothetical protein